jgi:hypothetical protein
VILAGDVGGTKTTLDRGAIVRATTVASADSLGAAP